MKEDHIRRRELAALADIVAMHLRVDDRLTCRQIGKLLGRSHEAIRLIETSAMAKIRSHASRGWMP